MIRQPAVAGQFYPASAKALKAEIASFIDSSVKKKRALAAVSPHAGYIYSGPVAGALYSYIEIPGTVIILGPNHRGVGPAFSLYARGQWHTPFGDAEIDEALADDITARCHLIKPDISAHAYEHSLEVQVPFLQYLKKDVKILPMTVMGADLDSYDAVANAVCDSIKSRKEDMLIVASSDMTHYESHKSAEAKDKLAIDAILKLDERLLLDKVSQHNISMCGVVPAAITLIAAKSLGATGARLIRYQTSAETSGDYSAVVGYAGIAII